MKIQKYGITLKKITLEDIEFIRMKRNEKSISDNMIYRSHITEAQQIKWFESINNFYNFYYLITHNNLPIGLISDKNMDWENLSSEAGLFVWEQEYIKSIIPGLATLILIEMGFEILKWNKTEIKVLSKNKGALSYNKQIGFKITNEIEGISHLELDRNSYLNNTRKKIVSISKLYQNEPLVLTILKQNKTINDKISEILKEYNLNIERLEAENNFIYRHKFNV